ncbi:MAG: PAS domain S-box protein [Acidobacteria bacterium]|nr:PAS domain S-box protein [Acidobacteriota bacterium]
MQNKRAARLVFRIIVTFSDRKKYWMNEMAKLNRERHREEYEKAEPELRDSEQRFRTLVEHGGELIEILDPDGTIKWASGAASKLMAMRPEDLVGKCMFELVHHDDLPAIMADFSRLVEEPGGVITTSARVRRADGVIRTMEGTGTNLLHVPNIEGIVLNVRDVTEKKFLEIEVERTRRVETLGRVAATMTHEFNNVLMGMQPWVDVLEKKHSDDESIAMICTQLRKSLRKGAHLTNEIRRFTHMVEPNRAPLEGCQWMRSTVEGLRSLLTTNVEVVLNLPDEEVELRADPELLDHVLSNLVLNAKDAMPEGGRIELTMHHCRECGCDYPPLSGMERYVHIRVSDQGKGIPKDVQAKMFDPLFTTKRSGTGLGLTIVQQIISAHRGHIIVESKPGEGTSFHLFIPSADA